MPLGTALLGLEVSDGICAVDLSQEFLEHAPQTALAQRMTILSLTNTLTQLDTIDALVLYAGGQPLSRYGSVDLSQPMTYEGGEQLVRYAPASTNLMRICTWLQGIVCF